MKRRLLSAVVAMIMIATMIYPAFTVAQAYSVWNGSTKTVPPTSGGIYLIDTAEELAWFANAVNSGSTSIKAKLLDDIYLNYTGSFVNTWTPIGDENHAFTGTFDGNGYSIHGLYINSTENYMGLFGNVYVEAPIVVDPENDPNINSSTVEIIIKNLSIVESSVTGNQNVGGIIGYGSRVGIKNCSYSGEVVGSYNSVGGVIGWANDTSVVSQCSSAGSVTGAQRTGGIAGFASSNTYIEKCYSSMSVTGTTNVGGIVGTLSGSYISGSFCIGSVSATDNAGGIVGYSAFGEITGVYAISTVTSTGTNVDGIVGKNYGGSYTSMFYSFETAGIDSDFGAGRTITEMTESNFVRELNAGGVYFCYDYTNINNGYPVLTWMLETDVWLGELTAPTQNTNGVYIIKEPSELAWFSALVNGNLGGIEANPAASATVVSDLLMNINVNDDTFGIIEWTPIGTAEHPYTGTFNGGGYNIAGIYTTSTSGTNGSNVGLFGYVGGGSIMNTVIIDGKIAGIENVGGIAGYVQSGLINNCSSSSEILGDKAVGGIVGNLASSAATITTCGMIGTITGTNYSDNKSYLQNVGGIVGYNNRTSITKCFSYAKIDAPLARNVGGLVGSNAGGTVTNSYNASSVTGGVAVGGLAGNNGNGTFTYCYSMAKIYGTTQFGMAFGITSGSNVTNCYFDGSFKRGSETVTGATELASSAMTGSTALTNMGFSTTNWKATASDQYYYYYPELISTYYSSVKQLKNATVESVKRVQNKYVARVEVDGHADKYYETIEEAIAYVGTVTSHVLPVVYLVRDVEVSATIPVTIDVGFFGIDGATLKRASTLKGPMFDVSGSLSISSVKYGVQGVTSLIIDGALVEGTDSGIVVESGGTLEIGNGVVINNFRTAANSSNPVKGAAIKVNEGTLNVTGGNFENNVSKSVGGVIYNNQGTVSLSNGEFYYNEGTQGAVIYNDNGTVNISGGTYSANIASLNGGVASTYGLSAKTVVSGTAILTENAATIGGALSVQNYATVEISGGTITSNRAYLTGGALQIEAGSEAIIKGGDISANYSDDGIGNAIYNNGTLSMEAAAQINSDNDIYLPTGKKITVSNRLTCAGYAATITPQVYAEGTSVLDGSAMSMHFAKFGVTNSAWHTIASGVITGMETTTVAMLSKNGAYSVEYISLAEAFAAVSAGEDAIITVVADNTISKAIDVNGDVTLLCDDSTFTSMRSGSYYGVLFNVKSGSTLRFGESIVTPTQQSQSDYKSGTDTAGKMILDGGYEANGVVGAAAVNVQSGGSFYMYDDAVIQNFNNTTTGTVTVSGDMYMYGGTIRNNASNYGGAVYVKASGNLDMFGGVICGNTSNKGGSAVYALGTVSRNIHTYNFQYVETLYDENGDVSGYADPVLAASCKTDILIEDGNTVLIDLDAVSMATSSSDIFITSLSQAPEATEFAMNMMTLDFMTYTIGATVVTGDNLIDYYQNFKPYREGYFINYLGILGINKLIPKSTSGLEIDRDTDLIDGLAVSNATVGKAAQLFENDKTLIQFYDKNGTKLKNTNAITTGCYIQLIDTSNNVLDTVTLVIYGDVNGDFNIDGQDSVMIRCFAQGMLTAENTSAAQAKAADVNKDGTIALIDAEHTDQSGLLLQTIEQ